MKPATTVPPSEVGAGASDQFPPKLIVSDGTIEALKWLAMVLMLLDHVNKFLYTESLPVLYEAGRLVLPLFGFVLAYNLVRPDAFEQGVHLRMMKRLALFGALACPPFVAMVGWWPLNILFMLLVVVAIICCWEHGGAAATTTAVLLFVLGGAVVEFWWFGVLYCLSAWAYLRKPTGMRLTVWIAATALLMVINRNLWALIALPVIFAAPYVQLQVPRSRWLFYAFYPAHLAVLWGVGRVVS